EAGRRFPPKAARGPGGERRGRGGAGARRDRVELRRPPALRAEVGARGGHDPRPARLPLHPPIARRTDRVVSAPWRTTRSTGSRRASRSGSRTRTAAGAPASTSARTRPRAGSAAARALTPPTGRGRKVRSPQCSGSCRGTSSAGPGQGCAAAALGADRLGLLDHLRVRAEDPGVAEEAAIAEVGAVDLAVLLV